MKEKKHSKDTEQEIENGEPKENDSPVAKRLSYEEKLTYVTAIAKPMAHKKLAKKIYKLIKKASKKKNYCTRGIKQVHRDVRKGGRGIMVLPGDVTPVEIICHLPAVCEDLGMSYVYIPSKADIGEAMGTSIPIMVVLIKEHEDYRDLFQECKEEIEKLPPPY